MSQLGFAEIGHEIRLLQRHDGRQGLNGAQTAASGLC